MRDTISMFSFHKVAVLFSAIALFTPTPALAESWVQLNDKMIIDADSVVMNGDLRAYWIRFESGSKFSMIHEVLSCTSGRKETMEVVVYNASGSPTSNLQFRPGEEAEYIIPGTKGATVLNFVCQ